MHKKPFLAIFVLVLIVPVSTAGAQNKNSALRLVPAQSDLIEQWAISAGGTSQYAEEDWGFVQATGAPDTQQCGDSTTAWASAGTANSEVLVLQFKQAVIPSQVNIYETYNPGAIVKVELGTVGDGTTTELPDSADPPGNTPCPGVFSLDITGVDTPVDSVLIYFDMSIVNDWNEIDAVQLVGMPAGAAEAACTVTSVPPELGLDPFYQKYCDLDGIPVVSSGAVPDAALEQAWKIARAMLGGYPAARDALIKSHVRIGVIGVNEVTTDMPEYADLNTAYPDTDWDTRGRGFGATAERPLMSGAEENLLCYPQDVYYGENIFVHEFSHTIKQMGIEAVDPTFQGRLQAAYDLAIAADRWVNTYAATNVEEYWAEGVQSYFDVNRDMPANTRAELATYDPDLYALIDEIFGAVQADFACPPLASIPSQTGTLNDDTWYIRYGLGTLNVGDVLTASTEMMSGDITLYLNLFLPSGEQVPFGTDLTYTVTESGTYFLDVVRQSGTTGTYTLTYGINVQ